MRLSDFPIKIAHQRFLRRSSIGFYPDRSPVVPARFSLDLTASSPIALSSTFDRPILGSTLRSCRKWNTCLFLFH